MIKRFLGLFVIKVSSCKHETANIKLSSKRRGGYYLVEVLLKETTSALWYLDHFSSLHLINSCNQKCLQKALVLL